MRQAWCRWCQSAYDRDRWARQRAARGVSWIEPAPIADGSAARGTAARAGPRTRPADPIESGATPQAGGSSGLGPSWRQTRPASGAALGPPTPTTSWPSVSEATSTARSSPCARRATAPRRSRSPTKPPDERPKGGAVVASDAFDVMIFSRLRMSGQLVPALGW